MWRVDAPVTLGGAEGSLMIRNLSVWHVLVLLLIVLLLFGAAKLPDIARNLGKSMKVMKSEIKDLREDDDAVPPATSAAPPAHPYPVQAAGQAYAQPPQPPQPPAAQPGPTPGPGEANGPAAP